ncbi:MAG: hypothetical protein RJS97_04335 [Parvibaculaceae bacterium]
MWVVLGHKLGGGAHSPNYARGKIGVWQQKRYRTERRFLFAWFGENGVIHVRAWARNRDAGAVGKLPGYGQCPFTHVADVMRIKPGALAASDSVYGLEEAVLPQRHLPKGCVANWRVQLAELIAG